ncbi:MAG: CDP-diacylglycerol--serine O-phosphatidyltransferase, partial [uncultured Lysobacter sp.]
GPDAHARARFASAPAQPGHLSAAEPVHHRRPVRGLLRDHRGHPRAFRSCLHRDFHRGRARRAGRARCAADEHAERVRRAVRLARRPDQLRPRAVIGDVPLGAGRDAHGRHHAG